MRVLLIYNPVAGTDRTLREQQLREVCEVFQASGHRATAVATEAAGSATAQARRAVAVGIDCIFACGGDGTIHDVLQGLVDESRANASPPILGIIPMGSANALARHLRISMSPVEAVRQQLALEPVPVSVGKIEWNSQRRYFTVLAGAGADGTLVYKMTSGHKQTLGRLAYYAHAMSIFLSHNFSRFDLEFVEAESMRRHSLLAISAMALRIDNLGGLFSRLTSGGHVGHSHLQLVVIRPPAWLSLPLWFAMGWTGVSRWNPLMRVVNVSEFTCTPIGTNPVHLQADGEWLGTVPARITLVPDAVRLFLPPTL
jgi:diacylglycerol kinase (ATP)